MREYLAQLRDEAAIYIKPGYEDSAATAAEKHPSITFSAYTPPSAKKKRKVERTRFRETTHSFRQKSAPAAHHRIRRLRRLRRKRSKASPKKDKPRAGFDEARQEGKDSLRQGAAGDLPKAPSSQTEDAGAGEQVAANASAEPDNPLESNPKPEKKTRTAIVPSCPSSQSRRGRSWIPRLLRQRMRLKWQIAQAQSGPLGLGGNQLRARRKRRTPRPATRPV